MPVSRLTAQLLSITLKPIYNMKILESFHRTARVKGGTIDTGLFHNFTGDDGQYNYNLGRIDYPVYYFAKVQICIFHVFWVTVWSAVTELTDEAVDAVNKRATELADTLNCTGL